VEVEYQRQDLQHLPPEAVPAVRAYLSGLQIGARWEQSVARLFHEQEQVHDYVDADWVRPVLYPFSALAQLSPDGDFPASSLAKQVFGAENLRLSKPVFRKKDNRVVVKGKLGKSDGYYTLTIYSNWEVEVSYTDAYGYEAPESLSTAFAWDYLRSRLFAVALVPDQYILAEPHHAIHN
jgi:hypothetical protein